MRQVHLVRHGEVANPRHVVYAALPGFGLSELGRRQAAEAGRRLVSRPIGRVVASPLERAVETAAHIAGIAGVEVTTDERLLEWGLATRWQGHPWDDLDDVFPGEIAAYWASPADLPFSPEPLEMVAARVAAAVIDHTAATDGDLVVVGHQDPIQAGRLRLRAMPLAGLHIDKPNHASVFTLEPGDPWIEIGSWHPPTSAAPFPPPGHSQQST